MAKLNGFGIQRSVAFLALVADSFKYDFDVKSDKPDTDGRSSLTLTASIGNGRGSTKLVLPADQVADVVSVLADYDPTVESVDVDLPIHEVVRRTLAVERAEVPEGAPEGSVGDIVAYTFKTSFKLHTREVRIPASDWLGFIDLVNERAGQIDAAIAYYRNIAVEEAKKEAEKQAKKNAAAGPVVNPLATPGQ